MGARLRKAISLTDIDMPRVTVVIITYNQSDFIGEAIRSVHEQTHTVDELVISDDGSTDNTFAMAQKAVHALGVGGAVSAVRLVRLIRQPKNLGFVRHFNQIIGAIKSDLIFYNAGDDISEPNRVASMVAAFNNKRQPRYFLGHSAVKVIDGASNSLVWTPPIERVKLGIEQLTIATALHIGASQVFTPALFHDFGPIQFEKTYEDLTLGFRALLTNAYHYESKPLLSYRKGGISSWRRNSYSSRLARMRDTMRQRAIDCLHANRPELFQEVNAAYQEFGLGLKAPTKRIPLVLHTDPEAYPSDRGWLSSLKKLDNVFRVLQSTELAGHSSSDQPTVHVWDVSSLQAGYLPITTEDSVSPGSELHVLYVPTTQAMRDLEALKDTQAGGGLPLALDTGAFRIHFKLILTSSDDLSNTCRSWGHTTPVETALEPIDSDRVLQTSWAPAGSDPAVLVPLSAWSAPDAGHVNQALIRVRQLHPRIKVLALADQLTSPECAAVSDGVFDQTITVADLPTWGSSHLLVGLLWQGPAQDTHHLWGLLALQGVPCVCRNQASFRPWVTQGETGLLVDPLADKWELAINMLIANTTLRSEIQAKAQEFAYFNLNIWKKSRQVINQIFSHVEAFTFPHFYPL